MSLLVMTSLLLSMLIIFRTSPQNGVYVTDPYCVYLRSIMVIHFLEFGIFWESLFTFLLIQIALWHKLDSSCKKDFTKIMQNDWKVNKLCWLFTQNQCRNNISIREIDTLLFFPLDFILESRISPRGRSCRAANDTSLKHQDHKGYFGALEFFRASQLATFFVLTFLELTFKSSK